MSSAVVRHFEADAERLSALYESAQFERVHDYLLPYLPTPPAKVLDIGAGSGRDASALAGIGHQVTAVEPSSAMIREARANHPDAPVRWVEAALPDLSDFDEVGFDLVLLSAVWMFVPPEERTAAVERIRQLCSVGGIVALSLRETAPDEPSRFALSDLASTQELFEKRGFRLLKKGEQVDTLGRKAKSWTTLVYVKNPV